MAIPEPIEYLDLDDLVGFVKYLNIGPVRDIGLLDSAVARPRSSAFGEDAYPSLALKAAALLHSLARNHPLVDGNKRLAWLAITVFAELNGLAIEMTDDAAFALVMSVAEGEDNLQLIAQQLFG